jgi:hypothetical protein
MSVITNGDVAKSAEKVIVVSTALPFLALIAVGLRFYTRRIKRLRPMVEDWLVLTGLIFIMAYAISIVLGMFTENQTMLVLLLASPEL